MKRILLTSPKFSGEIELLYGDEKQLLLLNLQKSQLDDEQISYLKNKLPARYEESFLQSFGKSGLTVIEEDYSITFEMFFEAYNKKVNKARCEKYWNRMSRSKQQLAFTKLYMYERHLAMNTWKTKADPETYLKNEYWDNDFK